MFFLLRAAFWLSLVILLLPMDQTSSSHTEISATEALGVASDTIADVSGFCDRNPDTCAAGGEALKTFSRKAQYGARLIYQYLDGVNGEAIDSANTLQPTDLEPAWRGPVAHKRV